MDHISIWYHKESWQATSRYKIMPVRGKIFYKLHNYLPIAPPKVEKKKRRPQTKRTSGANEQRPSISRTKLTVKVKQQACSIYKKLGHNKASYKKLIEAKIYFLTLYNYVLGLELALFSSLVFHKKMSTSKFKFDEDLKV